MVLFKLKNGTIQRFYALRWISFRSPGFNIWIIKDGKLYTPKGNLLEGITRKSVFEIAHELGLELKSDFETY